MIGNAHADKIDINSGDVMGDFDTLTYVDFTGKPKGNHIKDLMEFRNTLDVYHVWW